MKIAYVTGCLGFIGRHVTQCLLEKDFYVYGIDNCTYASDLSCIEIFSSYKNFKFENKNICDINRLVDCDYFINIAAETHVDNSIRDSKIFIDSNIYGVHNILELLKVYKKEGYVVPRLIHFSTDEVYGDISEGEHFETDILKPSNPYSATKAAADMLILAWARTYQIPYIILRPTNNYGIGQYVEKFIPHTIKYLSLEKKAPLHDLGLPKRTWLHAQDTANAAILLIEKQIVNEIFNVSGNTELPNIEVAKKILKHMNLTDDCKLYLDLSVKRAGQDVRYSIDDSKLKALGWYPNADFDVELKKIVCYYTQNFIW